MASIAPLYVFGVKKDIRQNLAYVDEHTFVYVAGQYLVVYRHVNYFLLCLLLDHTDISTVSTQSSRSSLPSEKMRAWSPPSPSAPIGAHWLSHTVARRQISPSSICPPSRSARCAALIVILTKANAECVQGLMDTESNTTEYVWMAFSPDCNSLITQGNGPEWNLGYWTWEKARGPWAIVRPSSQATQDVTMLSFNPTDNTHLCASGDGIFKLYRFSDNNLKQLAYQKLDMHNFKSHVWLSEDRLVAGTTEGQLLLLEGGELKNKFSLYADDGPTPRDKSVDCLAVYARGFLCASGGLIHFFEKSDESNNYKKQREESLPKDLPVAQFITSLVLSPSEDFLVCTTNLGQIYTMVLTQNELSDAVKVASSFHIRMSAHDIFV